MSPKAPKLQPVPVVDEAFKAMQDQNMLIRRKGRMATLIAGKGGAAPMVGTKALMGL